MLNQLFVTWLHSSGVSQSVRYLQELLKDVFFFSGSCLNKDILKSTWSFVHCLTKLTSYLSRDWHVTHSGGNTSYLTVTVFTDVTWGQTAQVKDSKHHRFRFLYSDVTGLMQLVWQANVTPGPDGFTFTHSDVNFSCVSGGSGLSVTDISAEHWVLVSAEVSDLRFSSVFSFDVDERRQRKGLGGGDEAEAAVWRDEWSGSTAPTRRVRRPVIPPAPRETRETRFWPEEHTLKSHLLDLTSVSLVQWKKQFHFYTGTVLTRVLLLYLKYFWYFTVDPKVLLISDTYSSTIHMSDCHYSNSNILTTYLDF